MRKVRKYFGTDGIRGLVGSELVNPEFVLKLGWAVGSVFARAGHGHAHVVVGKDTRISGYMLESVLQAGLVAAGVDIHLIGPMPTPAIAYLTRTFRAQAGIVISASHNAYQDNGLKFFSHEGFKLPDDLELAIEDQLEKPLRVVSSEQLGKAKRLVDAAGRYIEFCKSTVPSHLMLAGMKIIVDCAHGATYHVAPCVLRELGAEVVELGTDPDGCNINLHCGSTNPQMLQKIVTAEQADVGIAFDGDGDRVIMVDNQGEVVDGDELLFVIASFLQQQKGLRGGVVGTVMSNLGFERALNALGIDFKRTAVGDRHIMAELLGSGWQLGGEPSGHLIHLAHTTTGDGIVSALQVLSAMQDRGKTLNELKSGMTKFPQVMLNVPVQQRPVSMENATIQKAVSDAQDKLGDRGRIVLRPSGTEPVIRVMVEGQDAEQVDDLANELAGVVQRAY